MKILPIFANNIYNTNQVQHPKKTGISVFMTKPMPYDTVSFNGIQGSGSSLKKLAEYGMPDMYTGKDMMSYGALSRMLKNGVFDLPLNKLLIILQKYHDTLHGTEQEVVKLLKSVAKKEPDIKINEAFKNILINNLMEKNI